MPHFEALSMVVGWTPDQCEDIYTVLILPDTIIHVEIDRTDEQVLPSIKAQSLEDYRLELSKIYRIKLAVAIDILNTN